MKMTKQQFEDKYVGKDLLVTCHTKKLNDEFLELGRSFGYCNFTKESGGWSTYGEQTCYHLTRDGYGRREDYLSSHRVRGIDFTGVSETTFSNLLTYIEVLIEIEGYITDCNQNNTAIECQYYKGVDNDIIRLYSDGSIARMLRLSGKTLGDRVWRRSE